MGEDGSGWVRGPDGQLDRHPYNSEFWKDALSQYENVVSKDIELL